MEDLRPVCNWKLDANGFASDTREPPGGCRLPPGFKGWAFAAEGVDEHGHVTDEESGAQWKCNHRDTPEWKAAHNRAKLAPRPKKESHVSEPIQAPQDPQSPVSAPVAASVGIPAAPSAADLSKMAADAGGGATGVAMALIAVVGGGGAIWKFLQSKQKASAKRDELAHEQRMKELELQADNQKRDDDKHGECKAQRDMVAARLSAVDQRVEQLVRDTADLQRQLHDLVRQLSDLSDRIGSLKVSGGHEECDEKFEELSKRLSKTETKVKAKKS
jgi:hypothetical protein